MAREKTADSISGIHGTGKLQKRGIHTTPENREQKTPGCNGNNPLGFLARNNLASLRFGVKKPPVGYGLGLTIGAKSMLLFSPAFSETARPGGVVISAWVRSVDPSGILDSKVASIS